VPIYKWLFCPIIALFEEFYPLHYNHMHAVKFFESLDLDPIIRFLDKPYLPFLCDDTNPHIFKMPEGMRMEG